MVKETLIAFVGTTTSTIHLRECKIIMSLMSLNSFSHLIMTFSLSDISNVMYSIFRNELEWTGCAAEGHR